MEYVVKHGGPAATALALCPGVYYFESRHTGYLQ